MSAHLRARALERAGVQLSDEDIAAIERQCRWGTPIIRYERLRLGAIALYDITLAGRVLRVACRKGRICTIYPLFARDTALAAAFQRAQS